MKKFAFLLFLVSTVAFAATNVFIYGNKEATNLENNIGFQKHGQKIKTGDTDDPTAVAKAGNINSLYLRNGTYGAYLKSDNGTTTNWKMLENYLTFSAPLSRTGDTVSFSGIPLSSLTDVDIDPLADGDFLQYSSGSSKWEAGKIYASDLSDVDVTSVAANDILKWNDSNMKWEAADYPTISSLTDITLTSPVVDNILKYDGTKWVNVPFVAPISTDAVELYLDDTASDLGAGYKTLSYSPILGTEDIDTIVVNSATSPVEYSGGMYITPAGGIGVTTIPAGVWQLEFYCGVNSAVGVSSFRLDVYKRTAGGVETKLFEIPTGELNNTTVMLVSVNSVQDAFTVNATDRLGIRIYAITNSVANRTMTFVHNGSDRASHINTPLGASHNLLAGLQGGTTDEYYHLTAAQIAGLPIGAGTNTYIPYYTGTNALGNEAAFNYNSGTDTLSAVNVSSSALKVNGSSSGTATIQTPAAAGTPTITLPTVNTTMPTSQAGAATGYYLTADTNGVQSYSSLVTTYTENDPGTITNTSDASNYQKIGDGISLADGRYLVFLNFTFVTSSNPSAVGQFIAAVSQRTSTDGTLAPEGSYAGLPIYKQANSWTGEFLNNQAIHSGPVFLTVSSGPKTYYCRALLSWTGGSGVGAYCAITAIKLP